MRFKEAVKTPKEGWGRTEDEEKLLAALCDCLARACCLRAEQVFKWAKRHSSYRDLLKASERLTANATDMELLVAVLNDLPLGERQVAESKRRKQSGCIRTKRTGRSIRCGDQA
jgi:hypothetical protein